MRSSFSLRPWSLASCSILALTAQMGVSGPAAAQSSDPETVVVTGSRIANNGINAPTPVTVVSNREINQQAPTNIGDVLTQLPSFRPTTTPNDTGVTSNGGGRYLVDLRGLGSTRTLVLLDGHRFVSSSLAGQVDLNQVPTLLIDHTEVVTGGASAAYGSDAVSGVVNMILAKNLDGVKGTVQYGQSQLGDDLTFLGSLAYGTSFDGGKGSLIIGGDLFKGNGVGDQYTRSWGRQEYGLITNAAFATNGQPNFIISPNVRNSTLYSGGLVTAGPLKGTAFAPDGTPFQFQYGTVYGNNMIGGTGYGEATPVGTNLVAPLQRANILAHTTYDLTSDVSLYGEVSYAWTKVEGQSGQPRDQATLTILADNAYLPASVKAQMAANKLTNLTMGRQGLDFGFDQIANGTGTSRVLVGAKGALPDGFWGTDWQWDTYFEAGFTRYTSNLFPDRINPNWVNSIDAVVVTPTNVGTSGLALGSIACRTTLITPTNGCIPTNIFGSGNAKPNAYTAARELYTAHTSEQVVSLNLNGTVAQGWAGPISAAMGGEYRRETGDQNSDPISQQAQPNGTVGAFNQGNLQPYHGAYDMYEFYAETEVPLITDQDWTKSLALNAAGRVTDYSTVGTVETWKVGLTWSPDDQFRLRGTLSDDIRAPNLSELFAPLQQGGITSIPNKFGVAQQVLRYSQGNPNLKQENATTYTTGISYVPSWLSGFNTSIDYYNISIKNGISSLGQAQVAANCFSGQTLYCQYVSQDANGNLIYVNSATLNLNAFKTSGVDFEANYDAELADWSSDLAGNLRLRLLGTYVDNLTTIAPGSLPNNEVGKVSNNADASGLPKWTMTGDVAYGLGIWSGDLSMRYVGAGVYNPQYRVGAGAANTININGVSPVMYFDLGGRVQLVEGHLEFFGRVRNLFDAPPKMIPSGALGGTNAGSTSTVFYDAIGRAFTIGLRLNE